MSRCPALKSCTACNAASNCRWCGDMATGACYSNDDWTVTCMWSKYTCEEISKCYRTNPEFLGYGSPWVFVVNGIIAIVVVLLFTVFGMVLCSAFVNLSSKSEFVEDNRYFELSDFEQEESEDSSNDIAFPNDVDDTESDRWRHIPMLLRRTTPTCILLCEKYAIRICSALSLVTITIVIILICLSPHLPDFSICNSELDWRSLISTFENPSSGIQGEYILQASIYNPNKFDMVLTACTGYFKYANTNIGTFSIDNSHSDLNASFVVPAGTVNDLLFKAKLQIGVSTAASMYSQYFVYNDLKLKVKTDTTVGVVAYDSISYFTHYNLPEHELSLTDLDDRRCKCKLQA